MSRVPRVLVIGAGFGGCTVAQELSATAEAGHATVKVVDAGSALVIGACGQYCINRRAKPESIGWPLTGLQASRKVALKLETTVTAIDTLARTVITADGESLAYDYLVLATGTQYFPERIPGLQATLHNICKLTDTIALRDKLELAVAGLAEEGTLTVLIAIASMPYKCPPSPFEVAFLLDEVVQSIGGGAALRRGEDARVRIVVTSPKVPFPFGPPAVHKVFLETCTDRNIEFKPGLALSSVEPGDGDGGTARFADGTAIPFDLLAGVAPQAPPEVLSSLPFANPKGYIPSNVRTMRVGDGDAGIAPEDGSSAVFAIGDCAHMVLPSGKPHPKAGHFAHECGKSVAAILRALCDPADARSYAEITAAEGGVLPSNRRGNCFAEAGFGTAINLAPRLFADGDGPPSFVCDPPDAKAYHAKLTWIDGHLERFFGAGTKFQVTEE